jgi:hypothetical protein
MHDAEDGSSGTLGKHPKAQERTAALDRLLPPWREETSFGLNSKREV